MDLEHRTVLVWSIEEIGELLSPDYPGYTVANAPFVSWNTKEGYYDSLKRDIQENGVQIPLVVKGNALKDGHHRWRIAKELGITHLRILKK